MERSIRIDPDNQYIEVQLAGPLEIEEAKEARRIIQSRCEEHDISHVLADFAKVDSRAIPLLKFDDLAKQLKQDIPACDRMAMIYPQDQGVTYHHIENVCNLSGVTTRLFDDRDQALEWLLNA